MNTISLIGRLTAEPETAVTNNGTSVANFRLAVDRPHTSDKTDFINCVAFKKTADFCVKYFHKGERVGLTGVLTSRTYEKNGETRYTTEVIVDSFYFCETRNKPADAPSNAAPVFDDYMNDSELPF